MGRLPFEGLLWDGVPGACESSCVPLEGTRRRGEAGIGGSTGPVSTVSPLLNDFMRRRISSLVGAGKGNGDPFVLRGVDGTFSFGSLNFRRTFCFVPPGVRGAVIGGDSFSGSDSSPSSWIFPKLLWLLLLLCCRVCSSEALGAFRRRLGLSACCSTPLLAVVVVSLVFPDREATRRRGCLSAVAARATLPPLLRNDPSARRRGLRLCCCCSCCSFSFSCPCCSFSFSSSPSSSPSSWVGKAGKVDSFGFGLRTGVT
mmetsp:Transcript_2724/g.5685  ORF Transcript_2724/g.5685 Transcript_2724/m.5685 type:complete len:257 (+) Transcript_2724:1922-2692(+)